MHKEKPINKAAAVISCGFDYSILVALYFRFAQAIWACGPAFYNDISFLWSVLLAFRQAFCARPLILWRVMLLSVPSGLRAHIASLTIHAYTRTIRGTTYPSYNTCEKPRTQSRGLRPLLLGGLTPQTPRLSQQQQVLLLLNWARRAQHWCYSTIVIKGAFRPPHINSPYRAVHDNTYHVLFFSLREQGKTVLL